MGYPAVTKDETKKFGQRWDKGGIKLILDDATIQFATDWANIALRSFVDQMAANAKKQAASKVGPTQVNSAVPLQAEPVKSRIILTDA